ncbi:winged helix-turn-helix domain-containing protein [Microbispora sp. NEAU-D428]|uniref:AfsR/SARP family transcriptional regulator n=1 Tax=Microbispora sitophila TaxID=2771537 RepID=UPI0018678DAF|nr:BTAD domain-containing putative transcriptional regulator [Microbispora sitophila]MBE3015314.1 winged helix-turn-helix domain-containing protein [Microbispora sitophila]
MASDRSGVRQAGLRLRVLGPVTAWMEDRQVDSGPPLQRAALCVLAARAGRVVPKARLIGDLWGGAAPKTAEQSVYTYIAGLRRVLEPDRGRRGPFTLLTQSARGYSLARDACRTDAQDFEQRLAEARRYQAKEDLPGWLRELEAALALWAGPALGGLPGPFCEAERARLEGLRLTAREDHADALLRLGRPQEALETLTGLIVEDPLRERARELLMLALYRCGRQAEALEVFHDARSLLTERLGVDPGESLRRTHELILRADPSLGAAPLPTAVVSVDEDRRPRQLPRDPQIFVGRVGALVRLRALLSPWDGSAPQAVVAVTGTAGAGKSTLAVRAAHTVSDHYPDGQMYVNLLGATPGVGRLNLLDLFGRLLRSLGVRPEAVPSDPDEAATMLRDRLTGRRVLILLDDAAGPEQIRPLLGLPAGNALLVTSRESFAVVDDCAAVPLGTMPHAEAVTMLAKLAGAERVAADPAAATELVALCGGLPLALRLAAARLAENRHARLGDLNARLRGEGRVLHELESGDVAVRASLQLSFDHLAGSPHELDRAAAAALCHLGVLRTPDATPEVVAALLDVPRDAADRAVARLVRAHLAEPGDHGRFRLHDLVRLFAMELAQRRLNERDRDEALDRVLGLYGRSVRLVMRLLDPHRVHPPHDFADREPFTLTEAGDASAWLQRERANINALAAQAMASPVPSLARSGAHLGFSCQWPYTFIGHHNDIVTLSRQALDVGERLKDQEISALAHGYVALGLSPAGGYEEALVHQRAEVDLRRTAGDSFARMRALGNLCVLLNSLHRHEEALVSAREQLRIARKIGAAVGERHALTGIGTAQLGLGRVAEARVSWRELGQLAKQAGDDLHTGEALIGIAEVHEKQNDPWSAAIVYRKALALSRERHHRGVELKCLGLLGRAERLKGAFEQARAHLSETLAAAEKYGAGYWVGFARAELALLDGVRTDGDG